MLVLKLAHKKPRRIDVAAASEEAFKFASQKHGYRDDFEVIYTISVRDSYVAFSKAKGREAKELSERFSKTLHKMKKEGVIKRIVAKYVK